MDIYTLKTKEWLDTRYKQTNEKGIYNSHAPIYGFSKEHLCLGWYKNYYTILKEIEKLCLRYKIDTFLEVGCAEGFVAHLIKELDRIIADGLYKDSKSRFQEEAQERVSITPAYSVLGEFGPDHEKKFTIRVFLGKDLIAKGEGLSKQEAEEDAAKEALITKGW